MSEQYEKYIWRPIVTHHTPDEASHHVHRYGRQSHLWLSDPSILLCCPHGDPVRKWARCHQTDYTTTHKRKIHQPYISRREVVRRGRKDLTLRQVQVEQKIRSDPSENEAQRMMGTKKIRRGVMMSRKRYFVTSGSALVINLNWVREGPPPCKQSCCVDCEALTCSGTHSTSIFSSEQASFARLGGSTLKFGFGEQKDHGHKADSLEDGTDLWDSK